MAFMSTIPWQQLFDEATRIRLCAHAPYSQFQVGAAAWCSDGTILNGCNVENATYGLTVCAERHVMARAVAEKKTVIALAIVTGAEKATPPCGACRQVLAEFLEPTTDIRSRCLSGDEAHYTLEALLPFAFTRGFLTKK